MAVRRAYGTFDAQVSHLRARARIAEGRCERLEEASGAASEIERLRSELAKSKSQTERLKSACLEKQNRIDNLKRENEHLKDEAKNLRKQNSSLKWDVKVAHSEWAEQGRALRKTERRRLEWANLARSLGRRVRELAEENRALRQKLNKTPSNCSLPPSSDPCSKRVFNSRVKSGRKPGGQPGHTGHARKRTTPDAVVEVTPPRECPRCGSHALVPCGTPSTRRISDVSVSVFTTEYISQACTCTACGSRLPAAFPEGAANEENWGPGVKTFLTWLSGSCNVSIDDARGLLFELTDGAIDVSKGACANFRREFSRRAQGELSTICKSLASSPVVGSDATFTRSEGSVSYIYTFNSEGACLFKASDKKGKSPLTGSPIDGAGQILVHDHDTSYYSFGGAHAECNVHVLRYLKGVRENEPERTWAAEMASVLKDALVLAKQAKENSESVSLKDIKDIEDRYDGALELAVREYDRDGPFTSRYRPEGIALARRLAKYREEHLLFLKDSRVPFDNNASERALRCVKSKTKQSGGFRSTQNGEKPYCDYLSVVKTAQLRKLNPYKVVRLIFEGKGGVLGQAAAENLQPDQ